MSVTIARTAAAKARLGRAELKAFKDWKDGRFETELSFKFYRQATNKIAGLLAGGIVNSALITLSPMLIPPPAGGDVNKR